MWVTFQDFLPQTAWRNLESRAIFWNIRYVPDEHILDTPRSTMSKPKFFSGEATHLLNPNGRNRQQATGIGDSAHSRSVQRPGWVRGKPRGECGVWSVEMGRGGGWDLLPLKSSSLSARTAPLFRGLQGGEPTTSSDHLMC